MKPPNSTSSSSQKAICTICYEDLNLIIEDLQSISICGHVFHELCLQQWLEYIPSGKKPTCPVCKQFFSEKNVTRLYFQSTGDSSQLSSTSSSSADAEVLAEEVRRLEGKLSAVSSTFEKQQMHLKELIDELSKWKEIAKREEARKDEIKKEKEGIQHFLRVKTEELSRTLLECSKLRERSLGLAKELAALKLATDLNLGEEEMVKLASVGHGANHENVINVLKSSLAVRNKNYKELMIQCNLLGRAETRALKKLEMAQEKILKLKTRLQEVEKALEEKENEVIRYLKNSKRMKSEGVCLSCAKQNLDSSRTANCSSEDHTMNSMKPPANLIPTTSSNNHPYNPNRNLSGPESLKDSTSLAYEENVMDIDLETDLGMDDDVLELFSGLNEHAALSSKCQNQAELYKDADINKSHMSGPGVSSLPSAEASTYQHSSFADGSWSSGVGIKKEERNIMERSVEPNMTHLAASPNLNAEEMRIDDISKQTFSTSVKTETHAYGSISSPGDPCFPGGLIGPEGANRNVAKWSRQAQTRASSFPRIQPSTSNGDLINVGADGRGGRIKVLRARDKILDGKAQRFLPKGHKYGAKKYGQSQGCLQMEHFFRKEG